MGNRAIIKLKDLPLKEWEQTVWMFERDIDSCLDKSWMENVAKAEHRELCEILRTIKMAAESKPSEELTVMEYLQTCNLQEMAEAFFFSQLKIVQDIACVWGGKSAKISATKVWEQSKGTFIRECIKNLKKPVSEMQGDVL